LSRPFPSRTPPSGNSFVRVNGKIRAREVRVIGADSSQLGVKTLTEALTMARSQGVDLVEVAPNATPPVCRLVDYGKYRYEQAKKDKESKKRQHANKVKEVQLSPSIDPHDFQVKLSHAIDFLCEEMKVKVSLRFRGREMAHKEFGFQVVERFIKECATFGHPDAPPKLVGRGIVLMLSPLPRAKRAKNPRQDEIDAETAAEPATAQEEPPSAEEGELPPQPEAPAQAPAANRPPVPVGAGQSAGTGGGGFSNNPFAALDLNNAAQ
jgi:translation initiation factor IF-3